MRYDGIAHSGRFPGLEATVMILSLMMYLSVIGTAFPASPPSLVVCAADPVEVRRVAADVVLKGGTLIDGTGAPGRRADLAVRGDRIVAVGTLRGRARRQGHRRLDADRRTRVHRPAHALRRGDHQAADPAQCELPDSGCDHDRHRELWGRSPRRRQVPRGDRRPGRRQQCHPPGPPGTSPVDYHGECGQGRRARPSWSG